MILTLTPIRQRQSLETRIGNTVMLHTYLSRLHPGTKLALAIVLLLSAALFYDTNQAVARYLLVVGGVIIVVALAQLLMRGSSERA